MKLCQHQNVSVVNLFTLVQTVEKSIAPDVTEMGLLQNVPIVAGFLEHQDPSQI
jgi:hypothetical protein